MSDAQQAAKYLRSLLKSPRLNLEQAEALEGAATIIEGFGRNEAALLRENDQLRALAAKYFELYIREYGWDTELDEAEWPEGLAIDRAVLRRLAGGESER